MCHRVHVSQGACGDQRTSLLSPVTVRLSGTEPKTIRHDSKCFDSLSHLTNQLFFFKYQF